MSITQDFDEAAAPQPVPFQKTKWGVVWLLTLTLFSALTVGGLLAPIQESVKADLGITDLQLALVIGAASAVPVAILSMPIAWLADHSVRTRLLIILASLWAIGTIATGFVENFYGLFAARLVAGIGAGSAFPVLISILADVCMPERRGRSMVLISIGAWGGAAAAFAIGGSLFGYLTAHPLGWFPGMQAWRETHLLTGIGSALLVLPLFLLKEPERREVEQTSTKFGPAMAAFWRRRNFLVPVFIGNFSGSLAEGAAALWIGSVLVRQYGLAPGDFGAWVGAVILGAGIIGSIIGGFASDAGHKLKMRGGILLPAVIATAISIPASFYPMMPTITGFAWVLFVLLAGGTVVNLVNSAAIAVLIPNEERALSLAALKIIGTVVGAGVVPPIIVWMTQLIDGPSGLGQAMAWLGVITGFISLAGYWIAMVNAPPPAATLDAEAPAPSPI